MALLPAVCPMGSALSLALDSGISFDEVTPRFEGGRNGAL
jgi:hypothetical protein